MRRYYVYLFMSTIVSGLAELDWNVHRKIYGFGETLQLFCKLDECCDSTAGWVKWKTNSQFETIIFGIKNTVFKDNSKYAGKLERNGFYLLIRNVSHLDLNARYSCTHGFDVGAMKYLTRSDAFVGTDITEKNNDPDRFYIVLGSMFILFCLFMLMYDGKRGRIRFC